MQKEILIHVGTHKTGTTSLQNFLGMNRNILAESDDIYIPVSGTLGRQTGHHNIAWELLGNRFFKKQYGTLDNLMDELSKADFRLAILTSEDFEYLINSPGKIEQFNSRLQSAGLKTKYLAYFRETKGYAKSLFLELNKRDLESNWSEFLQKVEETGCVSYQDNMYFEFDRTRFISQWKTIIGDNFIAMDYDAAKESPGVVASFLETIGASPEIIQKGQLAKRFNKTTKKEALKFHLLNMKEKYFNKGR